METEQTIQNWKEEYKTELKKSEGLLKSQDQIQNLKKEQLENLLKDSIVIKDSFSKLRENFFTENFDRINSATTGYKDEYNLYQWAESARFLYDVHQNYENQLTYTIQQIHNNKIIVDAENSLKKSRLFFIGGIIATVFFSIISIIKSYSDNNATDNKINKIQTDIDTIHDNTDSINKKLDSIYIHKPLTPPRSK